MKALSRDAVLELVVSCLSEGRSLGQVNEETKIFGCSVESSLELVIFITDVEQKLQEDCGIEVTLADDRAMSQKNSPFRSVGTFTDFICELLGETHA